MLELFFGLGCLTVLGVGFFCYCFPKLGEDSEE